MICNSCKNEIKNEEIFMLCTVCNKEIHADKKCYELTKKLHMYGKPVCLECANVSEKNEEIKDEKNYTNKKNLKK